MASRIVILGPNLNGACDAYEVNSLDAEALVAGGNWRVSFTRYAGMLADAMVIVHTKPWLADNPDYQDGSGERASDLAFESLEIFLHGATKLSIPTPIPLA